MIETRLGGAEIHDQAADLFERLGELARATKHRSLAVKNRERAEAMRARRQRRLER